MKLYQKCLGAGALVLGLSACEPTSECKALESAVEYNQKVLKQVKARASLVEKSRKNVEKNRSKTQELMEKYGFNLAEEQMRSELDKRAKAIPGVKISREVREVETGLVGKPEKRTFFTLTFKEKNAKKAQKYLEDILRPMPMFNFITMGTRGKGVWFIELARPEVEQVPIKTKPAPLPKLKSAENIASEFGFCGASKMRTELETITKEYKALSSDAKETTVNLPVSTSWVGLGRRTGLVVQAEEQVRDMSFALLAGLSKAKLNHKGLGTEGEGVILEFKGGDKDAGKLEQALPEKVLQSLVRMPGEKGLVRFIWTYRKGKAKGQGPHKGPHPGHKGHDHGHEGHQH